MPRTVKGEEAAGVSAAAKWTSRVCGRELPAATAGNEVFSATLRSSALAGNHNGAGRGGSGRRKF